MKKLPRPVWRRDPGPGELDGGGVTNDTRRGEPGEVLLVFVNASESSSKLTISCRYGNLSRYRCESAKDLQRISQYSLSTVVTRLIFGIE